MDILVNKEGDLELSGGDIVTGDSQTQDIEHIMLAQKGQFTQFPLIGVGIRQRLNGPLKPAALKRDIRIDLESDGFNVNSIDISEGQVQVDAQK